MVSVEKQKLPNLFIVGTGRGGTASLWQYLKQMPDVFMSPIKEPNYFARRDVYEFHDGIDLGKVISDFQEYINLFKDAGSKKIRGEASVNYLYSKYAPLEIFELIPEAKIIISLRNPVERAYSHFIMNLQGGVVVAKSFCVAIKKRPLYLWQGLYYEHVKRYLEIFPKQNVKIIIFDDLKRDTLSVVRDICKFLEIDESYIFNIDLSKKHNTSSVPKSLIIHQIALRARILKKILPPLFYERARLLYFRIFTGKDSSHFDFDISKCTDFLISYFKEDVKKLSELLGRDLSFWLENHNYKLKDD